MRSATTQEQLNERLKELSCLYSMSGVFLKNDPIESTLLEICGIVKLAWRFSQDADVSIEIDAIKITSALAHSISQKCDLVVFNEVRGQIAVHYPADKHSAQSFLEDEQRLLEKIAAEISLFYEKKLRDAEIVVLKRSAERADRLVLLGEITAGIAHELNTPMGNIMGYAELIAGRTNDKQILDDITKVIKAAKYSREIVKKLMFFSCEMPQHMQLINITPVVEEALKLLEPNFRKASVTYNLKISDTEIEAQLDPIQLTQVLFNVLVNAIYVSPMGSEIGILVYKQQDDLFLEISDQGPGIEAVNLRRIFEPFFTTKPFGEGSGLGLSVVHGIIKSHKGEISTFDNIPKGTVFKIRLPLKH